jgi:hypothetical protein
MNRFIRLEGLKKTKYRGISAKKRRLFGRLFEIALYLP